MNMYSMCVYSSMYSSMYSLLADSKECVHPAHQGDAITGRPQTGNIESDA